MPVDDDAMVSVLADLRGSAVQLRLRSGEAVLGVLRAVSAGIVQVEGDTVVTIRTAAVDAVASVAAPDPSR